MHTFYDMTEEEWEAKRAIRKHLFQRLVEEGFMPADAIDTFFNAEGETRTITYRDGTFVVDA